MQILRRQYAIRLQQAQQQARANAEANGDVQMADGTGDGNPQTAAPPLQPQAADMPPGVSRVAYDHVEEITGALKTNYPLLILSLETMVEQISHKFKQGPEEDVYRNICMLMQDAIQVSGLDECGSARAQFSIGIYRSSKRGSEPTGRGWSTPADDPTRGDAHGWQYACVHSGTLQSPHRISTLLTAF